MKARSDQGQKGKTLPSGEAVPGEQPLENEQHERFVQELLMHRPQVRAYLKAYPDSSYEAARANSCRLIADNGVKERFAFLKTEQRSRLRMDSDEIHIRLVMAAIVDPADLFDSKGNLLPIQDLPPEVRACIESVETTKGGGKKVTFISKGNALQMLGRHQKMFTDKVEHTVKVTLEELVGGEG